MHVVFTFTNIAGYNAKYSYFHFIEIDNSTKRKKHYYYLISSASHFHNAFVKYPRVLLMDNSLGVLVQKPLSL